MYYTSHRPYRQPPRLGIRLTSTLSIKYFRDGDLGRRGIIHPTHRSHLYLEYLEPLTISGLASNYLEQTQS